MMQTQNTVSWLRRGKARFLLHHCVPIDVDFVKAMKPTVFVGSLKHTALHDPWSGEAPLDLVEQGIDDQWTGQINDLQQSGIRVMTYIAAHQIDRTLFAQDDVERLAAREANGDLSIAFGTTHYRDIVRTCYNNPGWLDHMSQLQLLHLDKAGVDGLWVDISDIFIDCRCDYCCSKFRAEFGYDISETDTRQESKSSLFNIAEDVVQTDAHRESELRRHYEWRDGTDSAGGDAMISAPRKTADYNAAEADTDQSAATTPHSGTDLKKHKDLVDFRVRCYHTFFDEVHRRVRKVVGFVPPYVCNGYGLHKDGILIESGFNYAPYENIYFFKWGNVITSGVTQVTTRSMDGVASVSQFKIASGEGAAFNGYFAHWGHTLYNSHDLRKVQTEFHEFLERYEHVYAAQEEVASVGILVSLFSDQITGGTNFGRSQGFSQVLSDMHVPHGFVLADDTLTGDQLSEYELLIVPDMQIVGDQDFSALCAFAASGATVITTGQCGVFNHEVDPRAEKLDGNVIVLEGQPELDYLVDRLNGPDWGLFHRDTGDELKDTIEQALSERKIVTDAHVSVKFNLAETSQAHLLHMVNYECGLRLLRQQVYPKRDISVKVRVSDPIGKATLVSPDIDGYVQTLTFGQDGGYVDLVVPELVHYGMVMLEKQL